MNKKEWMAYFESLNERKPTNEELKKAKKDGVINVNNFTQIKSLLNQHPFLFAVLFLVIILIFILTSNDNIKNGVKKEEKVTNVVSSTSSKATSTSSSTESSSSTINASSQQSNIDINLETKLNEFLKEYTVAVDESVTTKSDKINTFFQSTNNSNYQSAMKDITGSVYSNFETAATPAKNITISGNIIEFTTRYIRKLKYQDGSPSETVYGNRRWELKANGDSFYIDSFETTTSNQKFAFPTNREMNTDEILKGDFSSISGKWVSASSTDYSYDVSPDGILGTSSYLYGQKKSSNSEVVIATEINKSHLGNKYIVYLVPKGIPFKIAGSLGITETENRDRFIHFNENVSGIDATQVYYRLDNYQSSTDKSIDSLDISAIAKGDTSSLQGDWKNEGGGEFELSKISKPVVLGDYLKQEPLASQTGAPTIYIIPKGVKGPKLTSPTGGSVYSESESDRIVEVGTSYTIYTRR